MLRYAKISLLALVLTVSWVGLAGAQHYPAGDLSGDCKVGWEDMRILAEQWLNADCSAPDCEADLDGVPGVNMSDFGVLADNWLEDYSEITLVINEFMAKNDGYIQDPADNDYDDWIEIYNYGDCAIDMGGMYLTDDDPCDPSAVWWQIPYNFPDETTIAGGGYLLIWADGETGQGPLHVDFSLGASGEYIGLSDADENLIDEITFGTQEADESYGRFPDGNDNWLVFSAPAQPPTPGQSNKGKPIDILISEIMYHPYHRLYDPFYEAEDIREEYIELFNSGTALVSLSGWQFSDGVDFVFPNNVTIGAGEYLVVAANEPVFTAKYPGVTNVIGGWVGRLSNSGEDIELISSAGARVNRVSYADEGDWAVRELAPMDNYGHRSWEWSEEHDGGGKSLELVNPALPNQYGQNWLASTDNHGTPGGVNSVADNNTAPLIVDVRHFPIIPSHNDPVTVTAHIIDELTTGITATLHYRNDESVFQGRDIFPHHDPDTYTHLTMSDNGAYGDGDANDGIYGAQIPAQPDGTIIEFYIEVSDAAANPRTWPAPALMDGTPEQVTNALYQVDDSAVPQQNWIPGSQPIYYIIMTEEAWGRMQDIWSVSDLNGPDTQLNATFISVDGVDTKCRYNTGVRNRGHGTRRGLPHNFRVNFPHDRSWKSVTAININSRYVYLQNAANAIFQLSGLPQPNTTTVQLRVNGRNLAESGSVMYGSYVHLEVIDSDFADNHFPDDEDGNAYKGIRDEPPDPQPADLLYRGPDPDSYRNSYFKHTNKAEDDWSDLIELCYIMSQTPDHIYVGEVRRVVNLEMWTLYFALNALLDNNETSLANGYGDDYYMYRGILDPRFVLIGHDLDQVFGYNGSSSSREIFRATGLPTIEQFLTHPEFVPRYYFHLKNLIETTFSEEQMEPFLDNLLGGFFPAGPIDNMKDFVRRRNEHVLSLIPSALTIETSLPQSYGYYRTIIPSVDISGQIDAIRTRSILANGVPAAYSPFEGTWSTGTGLPGELLLFLPMDTVWSYEQSGINLGTAWRAPDYNDSSWPTGKALLYVENAGLPGPKNTPLTLGRRTYYFRTEFYFDGDPNEVAQLQLSTILDDGAVIYLNDNDVNRIGIDPGTILYGDYADRVVGDATLEGPFPIPTTDLRQGDNVIAVEVHQCSSGSSDIVWGMELEAYGATTGGDIPLHPGINRVTVQTFDGPGGSANELERGYTDIWYDDGDVTQLSGTLASNTTLDAASGPWHVTGDVVVPNDVTLTIEPGASVFLDPGTSMTINGRLVAEGRQYELIRFTQTPGASSPWDGLQFVNTVQDNRIAYAVIEYGRTDNGMVGVENSNLLIDHVTLDHTDRRRIRTFDSSLIVRNSTFTNIFELGQPPTGDNICEHIWGAAPTTGHFIIENNVFGTITGHNDAIDVDGNSRPGPVIHILGNLFLGGGDDALDLEGDAHIEGNVFLHYRKDEYNTGSGNANMISAGGGHEYVVVRNVFYDMDHVAQVKSDSFMTFVNNTVVDVAVSALYFLRPTSTTDYGRGAYVDGSIFWNTALVFDKFTVSTDLTANRSIIPVEWHYLGQGNIDANAVFVDPNGDFHLKPGSAGTGTGPCGLDMGAYVPAGAAISGEPDGTTYHTSATLTVGGPDITHYKFSFNDPNSSWSTELSVDVPIELTGLANGNSYIVYVIGKNSAGVWQSQDDATASRTWTVDTSYSRLVINEVLAHTHGADPDIIELYYDGPGQLNLSDMSLADEPGHPRKFVFSGDTVTSTTMGPGSDYMILYGDLTHELNHLGFALSAEGEGLYLYDKPANGGGLLDSVEFGLQINDFSIGRFGYGSRWKLNQPTFGYANIVQPLGDPATLKINEWLANEEVLFEEDFIELYNPDALPVDLSELYITDNPVTQPAKQWLGPLSFAPPNGYAVFIADDTNAPGHLDFKLSADAEIIGLFDAELNEIDKVLYGPQTTDASQGRTPNGADGFEFFELPTPHVANPSGPTVTVTNLIAIDDVWSYEQSNTDLGTAWRAVNYNDTSWPTGTALLYVEGSALPAPKNTPLTLGRRTYYFRKHFTLDIDPNDVTSFEFSTIIDDGAVVYINGREVSPRIGMQEGVDIYFNTFANRTIGNADYEGPFPPIPTDYFVQGDNVIAVEVHQCSDTSSDIVFGLELDAVVTVWDESLDDLLALLDGLRITELMYHDPAGSEYDYIELQNVSDVTLDLTGVRFVDGVEFTFPAMTLDPGEYTVVVSNLTAFESRYGTGINVAGEYSLELSNGGEDIVLTLAWPLEAAILRFEYDDVWYPLTDGDGYSLVIRDPTAKPATWDQAESWDAAVPSPGG